MTRRAGGTGAGRGFGAGSCAQRVMQGPVIALQRLRQTGGFAADVWEVKQ